MNLYTNLYEQKWGSVVAADGHAQVPHGLLRNQGRLKLSDGELCTLIALIDSWWDIDQLPFMSTATLAKRRNTTQRTIERQLKALLAKGFVEHVERRGVANKYTFVGLKRKLEELAQERAAHASQRSQAVAVAGQTALSS